MGSSIASLFDSSNVSASGQAAVDDYLSTLKLLEPSVRNLPDMMDTDRYDMITCSIIHHIISMMVLL
jgi:hypothetical protein